MIIDELDFFKISNRKYKFYVFFDYNCRYFYLFDIIKKDYSEHRVFFVDKIKNFIYNKTFIKEKILYVFFLDKLKTQNSFENFIKFFNYDENIYIFIYKENLNINNVKDYDKILIVNFKKLSIEETRLYIKNILFFYKIEDIKIDYLADLYKTNFSEFVNVMLYFNTQDLYCFKDLKMRDFVFLKKKIRKYSIKNFFLNIDKKKIANILYIFNFLKNETKNYNLLINLLFIENLKYKNIIINFTKLEQNIKNKEFDFFWFNLLKKILINYLKEISNK